MVIEGKGAWGGSRVGVKHAPDDLAYQMLGQSENGVVGGRLNDGQTHGASPVAMDWIGRLPS